MSPSSQLTDGRIVDQTFRLLYQIGDGGFGSVWAARHVHLDKDYALKFLHDNTAAAGLKAEAQIQAQLSHPGIVRVTDYREGTEESPPFLVMDYVKGITLADWFEAKGPLSLTESKTWQAFRDIASAIDCAHQQGVIHGDLSARNAMLLTNAEPQQKQSAVVLDFGLASRIRERSEVGHRALCGTPMFMAAELLKGGVPTPETDRFAFFVLLFWAISGDSPYGTSLLELHLNYATQSLQRLSHSSLDQFGHEHDNAFQRLLSIDSGYMGLSATEGLSLLHDAHIRFLKRKWRAAHRGQFLAIAFAMCICLLAVSMVLHASSLLAWAESQSREWMFASAPKLRFESNVLLVDIPEPPNRKSACPATGCQFLDFLQKAIDEKVSKIGITFVIDNKPQCWEQDDIKRMTAIVASNPDLFTFDVHNGDTGDCAELATVRDVDLVRVRSDGNLVRPFRWTHVPLLSSQTELRCENLLPLPVLSIALGAGNVVAGIPDSFPIDYRLVRPRAYTLPEALELSQQGNLKLQNKVLIVGLRGSGKVPSFPVPGEMQPASPQELHAWAVQSLEYPKALRNIQPWATTLTLLIFFYFFCFVGLLFPKISPVILSAVGALSWIIVAVLAFTIFSKVLLLAPVIGAFTIFLPSLKLGRRFAMTFPAGLMEIDT